MKLTAARLRPFRINFEGSDLPRILRSAYAHDPKGVGSGASRFSSPSGAFRVLYAAEDFQTALAEAVIRDRFIGRTRRYIGRSTLDSRSVTLISTTAPLRLLDVRGDAAYRLGIDTNAVRARIHTPGQEFSEALHAQTDLDGLLYDSRLTTTACVAIYERGLDRIAATPAVPLIAHAELAPELSRLAVIVRRP